MLQRFLLLWLVVSSSAAFWWPEVGPSFDPFVVRGATGAAQSRVNLGWVVAITMFAVGSLLPRDEITQVLRRWPRVLAGTAIQYTSMPLLAFALAHLFRLPREMFVGVVMVGCVPGAMASNVLTLAAKGNVSYSVSLTTAATLLSPIVVPLMLLLTLRAKTDITAGEISLTLLREVVGPVVAGHLLCRRFDRFAVIMGRIGAPIANLAILWIIATVVAVNRDRLEDISGGVLLALLLLNLLGYTAGHAGGRLLTFDAGMRRALTLEIGMQNAGVGTRLALAFFPTIPAATIPTAAYTFGCMLTGTILAQWWAFRSRLPEDGS